MRNYQPQHVIAINAITAFNFDLIYYFVHNIILFSPLPSLFLYSIIIIIIIIIIVVVRS